MFVWVERAVLTGLLFLAAGLAAAGDERYGLGEPATPEQIAGWDIDIRPDGKGLPPGQGNAKDGEQFYIDRCASCHGDFGEGRGRYPALMGGTGSLASADPVKTIGSYWPYATTVFDYIRRTMPFGHAQSLKDDEVYAITAYLLYLNEIVDYEFVADADSLPEVEMPNRDGFIPDDRPDVPLGEPCMKDCRDEPEIVGRARQIDVTPDEGENTSEIQAGSTVSEADPGAGDPADGKEVFTQCTACHSVDKGDHRVGPSLNGIFGRVAGTAEKFSNYSPAMKQAGFEWSEDKLREFLESPQQVVSGTNMTFAGIKSRAQMDDLIAYLRDATAVD